MLHVTCCSTRVASRFCRLAQVGVPVADLLRRSCSMMAGRFNFDGLRPSLSRHGYILEFGSLLCRLGRRLGAHGVARPPGVHLAVEVQLQLCQS